MSKRDGGHRSDGTAVPTPPMVQRRAGRGTPGRRTLVEQTLGGPVQRRASTAGAEPGEAVHTAAARGVEGAGGALPHLDTIQQSFGRHDVGGVSAHVGPQAAEACETIGAEAYASGRSVAFAHMPDLHTAAHEAAHVVQQRGGVQLKGGVGEAGDEHERHADAVADRVVAGQSAEGLLDGYAGGAHAAPAVQRTPSQISNRMTDGPYGWTSSYQVTFTATECNLVIKIKVNPQSGVTPEQVTAAQQRAQREFRRIWDNRFRLTERGTDHVYTVRTSLSFVESGEHLAVSLHAGSGRANRTRWYVRSSSDVTYAHELGHQIGLKDEYVDPDVPNRARADSPGVHTDHSIMGNYHSEGADEAEPRLRHGQTIAGHIGSATERQFDASMAPREE